MYNCYLDLKKNTRVLYKIFKEIGEKHFATLAPSFPLERFRFYLETSGFLSWLYFDNSAPLNLVFASLIGKFNLAPHLRRCFPRFTQSLLSWFWHFPLSVYIFLMVNYRWHEETIIWTLRLCLLSFICIHIPAGATIRQVIKFCIWKVVSWALGGINYGSNVKW